MKKFCFSNTKTGTQVSSNKFRIIFQKQLDLLFVWVATNIQDTKHGKSKETRAGYSPPNN